MVTFLFWNLNKKPLENFIANLAELHKVDVLIFAECEIPIPTMLKALNRKETLFEYASENSSCDKIKIYTRFSSSYFQLSRESGRFTIRRLTLPGRTEILLSATHFISKNYNSNESQSMEAVSLSDEIKKAEELVGHRRTILVGDLNMNPFDTGMISAKALHGVMTREIAQRQTRIVQEKEYPFFYNPMWSLLGDGIGRVAGTYYNARSEQVAYFWHNFDQVLLRPDLLPFFKNEDLHILTSGGETSFLNEKGIIDSSVASDHLPILFSLNL